MGKKDIMKIECPIDYIDLEVLGFIDHNITVNIVKDEEIVEKKELTLPKEIRNIVRCRNPRCITSIEQELDQVKRSIRRNNGMDEGTVGLFSDSSLWYCWLALWKMP